MTLNLTGNSSSDGISTGIYAGGTSTTSAYVIYNAYGEATVEGFEFKQTNEGNFVEVIKRQKPSNNLWVGTWPPQDPKDRVFKEVYGIKNNKLELIKTIEAEVIPGHYVDEAIEFPE